MRLIDWDALINEAGKLWSEMPDGVELSKELMKAINHAPTVATETNVLGKWISVKDRLPESNEAVLISVYDKDGKYEYQAIAVRYPCGDWDSTDDYFNQGDGEVKYWMPLPEPPKEGTP